MGSQKISPDTSSDYADTTGASAIPLQTRERGFFMELGWQFVLLGFGVLVHLVLCREQVVDISSLFRSLRRNALPVAQGT